MTNQWDPDGVFDILADEKARQILVTTNVDARSAQNLAEICDGSVSAIYRRIDVMSDYELLEERTKIDPGGHHYSVYSPDEITDLDIELEQREIRVEFDSVEYSEQWAVPAGGEETI